MRVTVDIHLRFRRRRLTAIKSPIPAVRSEFSARQLSTALEPSIKGLGRIDQRPRSRRTGPFVSGDRDGLVCGIDHERQLWGLKRSRVLEYAEAPLLLIAFHNGAQRHGRATRFD